MKKMLVIAMNTVNADLMPAAPQAPSALMVEVGAFQALLTQHAPLLKQLQDTLGDFTLELALPGTLAAQGVDADLTATSATFWLAEGALLEMKARGVPDTQYPEAGPHDQLVVVDEPGADVSSPIRRITYAVRLSPYTVEVIGVLEGGVTISSGPLLDADLLSLTVG